MRVVLTVAVLIAGAGMTSGCSAKPRWAQELARAASTAASPPRLVVRKRILTFVDEQRTVRLNDGETLPRRLRVVVRYPVVSGGGSTPRPLIVFGHGYALSPRAYQPLLYAWAQAGYVVAAPAFPGEAAGAVGGPTRADLANEPGDIRFLVGSLLASSRRAGGALSGRIDPSKVVVAGHSDGGDAALAAAFDPRYRVPGVVGAVILAGADLPGVAPFAFPRGGPALLAVQGTADPVNPPSATSAFYDRAPAPKVLVWLLGAGHYGPYMSQRPQVRIVERTTIAFLDRVVGKAGATWSGVLRTARARGLTRVQAALS